jgi:hypothetical protein
MGAVSRGKRRDSLCDSVAVGIAFHFVVVVVVVVFGRSSLERRPGRGSSSKVSDRTFFN